MSRPLLYSALVCLGIAASSSSAQEGANLQSPEPKVPRLPGMQRSGLTLLPNQWSLRPAGSQIKLGDFPVNVALHPKAPFAAVLHAGYGEHEIAVVDLKLNRVVSRASLPQVFYGLCFDNEGKRLFASGAEHQLVHQFTFADGYLLEHRELRIGADKDRNVAAGLWISPDDRTLYVASAWGQSVCTIPLDQPDKFSHLGFEDGSYPYTGLMSKSAKQMYVSLWGKSAVAVVDVENAKVLAEWPVQPHPTELALSPNGKLLYVACANTNSVVVLDTESGKALESISSALHASAPPGSTPNSLALSPDGRVLLIANADNNNIAVAAVDEPGKSRSLGFIPAGWYPTSVRFDHDGRILIANGKGLTSKANRNGPKPGNEPPATIREYIGGLFQGTLSVVNPPSPEQMARYSRQAYACSPLQAENVARAEDRAADNPIPAKVGDPSPIKYCVYIIKENRTYDQVLGDIEKGNGDPNLCIFGEPVTPNHHALVNEFVLLDNFYVESEVSADGHEWTMAAYATDFVEKSWPLVYREGGRGIFRYPSEGGLKIAFPAGGYLWDRCAEKGVSYYSYGEFVDNGPTPNDPATARLESLKGHFDPRYRSFDMDYQDQKRADRFLEELQRWEREGDLPRFTVVRLTNDHTAGTKRGAWTPTAMVADNDLALGRVVEAISNSKFWKDTAIFVVQDDAQNGSDHVDAHRTVALVISPYTKRRHVDSNLYSTASMLRTMELILGLEPMSQFDAAALPMYASFQAAPDLTPFKYLPAKVDINARNDGRAFGADISAKFDFSKEDAADDLLLNEVVWRSVRGNDSRMPPPVRAAFVRAVPEPEEDDDD
jgi:DNA-binding beta-propeller fold protein YncE